MSRRGTWAGAGRDQEGAALILALVILTSFALIIGALLSLGGSSLVATSALRSQRTQIYAAEAAIDEAITQLRGNLIRLTEPGGEQDQRPQPCDGLTRPPPYSIPKASPISMTLNCTQQDSQTFVLSASLGTQRLVQARVVFDSTTTKIRIQKWDGNHER